MRLYSIPLLHRTWSLIAVLLLSLNLQAAPLLKSPSGNLTAEVSHLLYYLPLSVTDYLDKWPHLFISFSRPIEGKTVFRLTWVAREAHVVIAKAFLSGERGSCGHSKGFSWGSRRGLAISHKSHSSGEWDFVHHDWMTDWGFIPDSGNAILLLPKHDRVHQDEWE